MAVTRQSAAAGLLQKGRLHSHVGCCSCNFNTSTSFDLLPVFMLPVAAVMVVPGAAQHSAVLRCCGVTAAAWPSKAAASRLPSHAQPPDRRAAASGQRTLISGNG
ncbi:hypothetical protein PLESTB_000121400 [Pleodorina starrii]|uniref:Uncharacterized protein n=1 Tax=Pleodorina starrii TaxID=330485 RepID=A0A9W6BAU5_9CHLO|nr:hypothetical protein PLESTB_000121400 [Pleodorina starrii]GLC76343.1 hypothetical protein PLESTF_001769400 [Pleodorina starrii]